MPGCLDWMEFLGKMECPASQGPRVSRERLASREIQACPGPRESVDHQETWVFRAFQDWEK